MITQFTSMQDFILPFIQEADDQNQTCHPLELLHDGFWDKNAKTKNKQFQV